MHKKYIRIFKKTIFGRRRSRVVCMVVCRVCFVYVIFNLIIKFKRTHLKKNIKGKKKKSDKK